jgi:hypothetical protein
MIAVYFLGTCGLNADQEGDAVGVQNDLAVELTLQSTDEQMAPIAQEAIDHQAIIVQEPAHSEASESEVVENPEELIVAQATPQIVVLPVMIQKPDAELAELESSVCLKEIEYLFQQSEKNLQTTITNDQAGARSVRMLLILANGALSLRALSNLWCRKYDMSGWIKSGPVVSAVLAGILSWMLDYEVNAHTKIKAKEDMLQHKALLELLQVRARAEYVKTSSDESKRISEIIEEALMLISDRISCIDEL